MKDKIGIHIDSNKQDSELPEYCPDECPDCKVPSESGFGMAGGGMGVYTYCPQCGKMLGKVQCE